MRGKTDDYEIALARWPEDTEQARALLTSYGQFLAASPVGPRVCALPVTKQSSRALPGKYAGNEADLLLARVKGEGAGCVAITQRVLKDGMLAAEMKRLWVEPRFSWTSGLGRGLVHAA